MSDPQNTTRPEPAWVQASRRIVQRLDDELREVPERGDVWELALKLRDAINEGGGKTKPVPFAILSACRDPEREAIGEQSFRRGYVHGYSQACDDIDAGKTKHQRDKHVDTLNEWRAGDCDHETEPPAIGQNR